MHRIKVRSSLFSRRWYGLKMRNGVFCSRYRAGGLVLNASQEGLGRVLWRYFNAPGNVMFVTINLATFAGIVTYNSFISANRERLLEEKMLVAQGNLETGHVWHHQDTLNDEREPIRRTDKELHEVIQDKTPDLEDAVDEDLIPLYEAENLHLSKGGKCATFDSQMAKMSLFHMIYAYFLCRQVASNDSNTYTTSQYMASEQWKKEVEMLKKENNSKEEPLGNQARDRGSMNEFYELWKTDFVDLFSDLPKSQQFHFPDWKYYPGNLRYVCKTLYNNEMTTIEDFEHLYDAIDARDVKRLLRLWLYDHSHLFRLTSPAKQGQMEKFYRELIGDCHNDDFLLSRYSSVLLNPTNPRKSLFFPKCCNLKVPSASIDTVLSVLQEYVSLHEIQGKHHYNAIIRLISMIRKDCMIAKAESDSNKPHARSTINQVRVLLPRDEERESIELEVSANERKKCFRLVSHNSRAVKLLDAISNWEGTRS